MRTLVPIPAMHTRILSFSAIVFSALASPAAVTNVVWYRLGERDAGAASGVIVTGSTTDLMGVRHLTPYGNPRYTNRFAAAAASQVGSSLSVNFNGTSQYLSNAVVSTATNNFGLEVWVKPNAIAAGNRTIVYNGDPLVSGWGLIQRGGTEYKASFGTMVAFGSGEAAAGVWAHLALVRDNGTTTFYVNGVPSGTSVSNPVPPAASFIVAAHPQFIANTWFNGAVDEIRVFTFAPGQFTTNDLLLNRIAALPVTGITATNATLNGRVNPSGFAASAWFEWGTNTSYGNVTGAQLLGSGGGSTNFSQVITGLLSATTYHYRAVSSNLLGLVTGANGIFSTTDLRPISTTVLASNVTVETARLYGVVNPNGSPSTAWFQWGTTTNYGNATAILGPGVGTNNLSYNDGLANLQGSTTYHFRAVASNVHGLAYGTNQSFATGPAQPPLVVTWSADQLVGLTARLNGYINPRGATSLGWFEWGKTTNYNHTTPASSIGNGTNYALYSRLLTALEPNTTYHFRAVGSNGAGVVFSTNRSFTVGGINVGLDSEPNDTPAAATPLYAREGRITANIFPAGDLDHYSFTAQAGDRIYAAVTVMPVLQVSGDSQLSLIGSDGTTVLEFDEGDGSFDLLSSSIAGATIPETGTYYLLVNNNGNAAYMFPYDLWFRVVSGSPTVESEVNDGFPGQALPISGWVSGDMSSSVDIDYYSITLNAGDSVFLSLDLDPERDGGEWDAQLGMGLFSSPGILLQTNDPGTNGSPDSEALFLTVKNSGTYGIRVAPAPTAVTFGNYHLSATVLPAAARPSTTYASTNVPQVIPTGPGQIVSTLTIPDNKRIGKLRVLLNLTHQLMGDLDVTLTAPDGNTVGLFTDVGSLVPGVQTGMDLALDDEAALWVNSFNVVSGLISKADLNNRLAWFSGQQAQGTWTLTVRDDTTANGGTLNGWSLVVFDELLPFGSPMTIYSTDFETSDGGFTHSGLQDEWQRGMPSSAPITNCFSGVNCWKTDLLTNYNDNASNDLFSPNISLANVTPATPVILNWAMKYQMELARWDRFFVEIQEVGGGGSRRTVWGWLGPTMSETHGNPGTTVQQAAGWGLHRALISDFAGKVIRVRFHFESDESFNYAGVAIDDVSVTAYPSIIKSGGNVAMNLIGSPNWTHHAQYTTNLSPTTVWNEFIPPAVFTMPGLGVFSFTNTSLIDPMRFYRAVSQP